jgi:hypothetical protein
LMILNRKHNIPSPNDFSKLWWTWLVDR